MLSLWCEIVCRTCCDTEAGRWIASAPPKRKMVAQAKARGWLFKYDESFCSNQCVAQYEKENTKATGSKP